jgi:hypothetical protein
MIKHALGLGRAGRLLSRDHRPENVTQRRLKLPQEMTDQVGRGGQLGIVDEQPARVSVEGRRGRSEHPQQPVDLDLTPINRHPAAARSLQ